MRFSFLFILLFSFTLYAKTDMEILKNPDGTNTIRIPLNYESKNSTSATLLGARAQYTFKLPVASRWVVLSAKLKLIYTPSLAIIPQRSTLAVSFNNKVVVQKWINAADRGINTALETSLPAETFTDFNELTINGNQHYTIDHCEDETAPELWTKIDTQNSYIELKILPKILPPALSSIDHFLFDKKNITAQQVTFVVPSNPNKMVATSAVIVASSIGQKLKYRAIHFALSPTIPSTSDTIVIAPRLELLKILEKSFPTQFQAMRTQIGSQSIVFFANPLNPQYGIICITAESDKALIEHTQAFASYNFYLDKGNRLNINSIKIPEESTPYSAPNHLPTGKRISFKELGQATQTFKYMYPTPMDLNFKLYPDLFFSDKQNIKLNINGIYPTKVRHDSVLNISVNDKFASQLTFDDKMEKEINIAKYFNYNSSNTIPAYIVDKGNNKLSLQPAMVPFKNGFCELYNMENLQTTLMDNSYIEIPDAPHWIEMPYISYFLHGAYPFSIHPDGLKTAILMDSFSSPNLLAALNIGFFLGKEIEYPLYRITLSTSADDVQDKEIFYIGSFNNKNSSLFEDAQVKIDGQHFSTTFYSIYKFIDYLPFFSNDRLKPYQYEKFIDASSSAKKHLLLQTFQSPYDSEHSVIALQYDSPETLEKGIKLLFSPEQVIDFHSDTLIIDTELEKISSFEIANKYFLGTLNLFDKIRFYMTSSPLAFVLFVLLFLVIMAYVVRRLLKDFKEKNHPHV